MKKQRDLVPVFDDLQAWQRLEVAVQRWIGTPFLDCGVWRTRGSDCIAWLAASFYEAGFIRRPLWRPYDRSWYRGEDAEEVLLHAIRDHVFARGKGPIHWSELRLRHGLVRADVRFERGLKRGDVLLTQTGRTPVANHALLFCGGQPGDTTVVQCGPRTGVTRMSFHKWRSLVRYRFRAYQWVSPS